MAKTIAILGSTGSVGQNTLRVISENPEKFRVTALAAGTNADLMIEQWHEFRPSHISMATKEAADRVTSALPDTVNVVWGKEGLEEIARDPESEMVVSAVVGSLGLRATLAAIDAGKTIALANKETLVAGGELVMQRARERQVAILPVDSEHSAIFQCLNGEDRSSVSRIVLTASGGAFRHYNRQQLKDVTPEQALKHPNWAMGKKVTVDSATLMNKGLEVIEAHWLFDIDYRQIDVVIHYESIVHSMVEFKDKAVMAQLGTPDMRVPIQYALSYPDRLPLASEVLDLTKVGTLHFIEPDLERFPCLAMAYEAGKTGGTMPTVLNAANEVGVERFLNGSIPFLGIEQVIERVMDAHNPVPVRDLETVEEAEQWARKLAREMPVK
ncbi:1-deoxy-D-xylulose-5-phosphate reductoisomerase [Novibacillus thermophilus]|uniref:1-deoxy-D-xylulose 5-phosphate reductoisomerase n=1 Tax=Novibacillus thermophilus TaxID=1471761 RepID=A0A1U9KA02_9BACL|nr:1-deoxy-D-xylulose-5-phosphate reductoisomerase [Novibacillus thermophilus]AQS56858.1 1-deoxy-D-xylulose-5-phosphate reductoisomerase [Novibacillus thermophilus]